MAEYIKRADAIKRFEEVKNSGNISFKDAVYLDGVMAVLDNIQAADVVEVVRCDNCISHGNCLTEDTFRMARINNPYCCGGKKTEG